MIASNLLRKRIREIRREGTFDAENPGSAAVELAEDKNATPLEKLFSREKTIIICKQLQKMLEPMRLVTILILMEGLTQKEAAGILNRSEASVSRDLETARKWLRARL